MSKVKVSSKNVNVHYGTKQALHSVSLDINENEVTALIGPSGCGKSTFLRCINRMNDLIDICKVDGSITVDNEEIISDEVDVVSLRSKIGMVFQKPNPFPKSIFDNVAYGPTIHGIVENKSDLEDIVHSSLRRAGLLKEVQDRLHEPGTSLSGGQQQRLCIARAIVKNPEIILADEPTGNLDPTAAHKILKILEQINKEGTSVIMATHNYKLIAEKDYRIIELKNGRLISG